MKMKLKFALFSFSLCALLILACSHDDDENEAYGVFEATEITVSSENNGKLLSFDA
jgi:HlyD family secretion protein